MTWINPKISIKESRIEGKGLFCTNTIYKDEFLVIQGGSVIDDALFDTSPYCLEMSEICFQIEKGFHICPIKPSKEYSDGVFLINHSCNPNCGIRGQISFVALSNILPGEEITFDYAMTDSNYVGMPYAPIEPMECHCGSIECRKLITGDDWKLPNIQNKYNGYFSRYIQDMIAETVN